MRNFSNRKKSGRERRGRRSWHAGLQRTKTFWSLRNSIAGSTRSLKLSRSSAILSLRFLTQSLRKSSRRAKASSRTPSWRRRSITPSRHRLIHPETKWRESRGLSLCDKPRRLNPPSNWSTKRRCPARFSRVIIYRNRRERTRSGRKIRGLHLAAHQWSSILRTSPPIMK